VIDDPAFARDPQFARAAAIEIDRIGRAELFEERNHLERGDAGQSGAAPVDSPP